MGANVIIGGRSREEAIFTSAALYEGFPEPLAYNLGNTLAAASRNADIFTGSETVIGRLSNTDIKVSTIYPQSGSQEMLPARARQRCEYSLDLKGFQNLSGLTGETLAHQITLEGVGKIGERCIGLVHFKSAISSAHLRMMIDAVQQQIRKSFSRNSYQLCCNARQPLTSSLCIIIEGIAETEQIAEEITVFAARSLLASKSIDSAMLSPELTMVLPAPSAYRWTIRHTLSVDDPLELFEMHELLVE